MMYATDATLSKSAASMKHALLGFAKAGVVAGAVIGGVSIKMAADFDSSMRKVWSLTEVSEAKFKEWSDTVLDMSTTLPTAAKDLGDAMYWVKSAMPDATDAEMFKTLEWSAKGAIGALAEEADVVKALTGVMNAYKDVRPEHYIDIMTKSVERGSLTMADFAGNIGKVVGTAATAQIPFKEVAAAVSTLTKAGIPADTAFMALNRTMMTFLKPSKEAADLAQELGIDFSLASLRSKGLAGALAEIGDKVPDEDLARLFPNIRALKAVFPLLGQASSLFAEDLTKVGNAAGTTERMFGRNMESMENKLKVMMNKIRKPLIELGTKLFPYLEKGVQAVVDIIEGKNKTFNAIANTFKFVATAVWDIIQALTRVKPLVVGLAVAFASVKVANVLGLAGGIKFLARNATIAAGAAFPKLGAAISGLSVGAVAAGLGVGALAAVVGGSLIYAIHKADSEAQKLWDASMELEKGFRDAAESAKPLAVQVAKLQREMTALTPDTIEYLEKENELLEAQQALINTYPGLIQQIHWEGEAMRINIKDMAEYIELRGKIKGTSDADAGIAESILEQREGYQQLSGELREYYDTLEILKGQLDDMGYEYNDLTLIEQGYLKSFEAGTKELKNWSNIRGKDFLDMIKQGSEVGGLLEKLKGITTAWAENDMKSVDDVQRKYFEYFKNYHQMLNQMQIDAINAGKTQAAVPEMIVAALQSKDPILQRQGALSGAQYITEFFRGAWQGTPQELNEFGQSLVTNLQTGKFQQAWNQAGEHGGHDFVTSWISTMAAEQVNIASMGEKGTAVLAQALTDGTPEIRNAAAGQVWELIAAWTESIPQYADLGASVADVVSNGIRCGKIQETGDDVMNEAVVLMAERLGAGEFLDGPLQKIREKMESEGKLPDDVKKQEMEIWLEEHGFDQVNTKLMDTMKNVKILDGEKAKVKVTDGMTAAATLAKVKSVIDYIQSHGVSTMYVDVAFRKYWVNPAFSSAYKAGEYIRDEVNLGLASGGGVRTDIYIDPSGTIHAIPLPTILPYLQDVNTQLNAMRAMMASLPQTQLDYWFQALNYDILQVHNALNVLADGAPGFVEAWTAVEVAMQGANNEIKRYETKIAELESKLEPLNRALEHNQAEQDGVNSSIATYQHELDAIQHEIEGYNQQLAESQHQIELWNREIELSNERLTKAQDALAKWSSYKLAGETARDEKSFRYQQQINELQLRILQAEKKGNYEAAARLTLRKEQLEADKEIYDLQTQVRYDPQRRALEQAKDETYGQEAGLREIIKNIKKAQRQIKTETDLQDELNKKITRQNRKQWKINDAIWVANQRTRLWTEKIWQANRRLYELQRAQENINEQIRNWNLQIDEWRGKLADAMEDVRELAQQMSDLAEAIKRAADAFEQSKEAPEYQHGGPVYSTGLYKLHAGEYVLSKAMLKQKDSPKLMKFNYQGETVVTVPLYLDGKQIAHATTRVTGRQSQLFHRSGGK